jgi:hypothetical protein
MVAKPGGKRPLERRKCRWEDNIQMDMEKSGLMCLVWIHVVQERGE